MAQRQYQQHELVILGGMKNCFSDNSAERATCELAMWGFYVKDYFVQTLWQGEQAIS